MGKMTRNDRHSFQSLIPLNRTLWGRPPGVSRHRQGPQRAFGNNCTLLSAVMRHPCLPFLLRRGFRARLGKLSSFVHMSAGRPTVHFRCIHCLSCPSATLTASNLRDGRCEGDQMSRHDQKSPLLAELISARATNVVFHSHALMNAPNFQTGSSIPVYILYLGALRLFASSRASRRHFT